MAADSAQLRKQYEPQLGKPLTANPQVLSARFSPCGRQLLAASFDGRVRRWGIESAPGEPRELPAVGGHHGWVTSLAFAPAGDLVYSADSWGQIQVWPLAAHTPEPRWRLEAAHDGWVRDLAVHPNGQRIVSCGADRVIRVRSTVDGQLRRELDHGGEDIFCLRWDGGGQSLFSGDMKGKVRQWQVDAGRVIREFDASSLFKYDRLQDVGGVRSMALGEGGKWLAVGGTTVANGGAVTGIPTVLIFDIATGEQRWRLNYGGTQDVYVTDLAFHPAGFWMYTVSGQPGSGALVFHHPEHKEPFFVSKQMVNCHSISVHPTGSRLAVVATNPGSNGNGRRLSKTGEYEGNVSPIHFLSWPS